MMNLPWDHRRATLPPGTAADFPQRSVCFQPHWLPQALAAVGHAAATDAPAQEASVENVWYAPGKQLIVVYRLGYSPAPQALVTVAFDPPARTHEVAGPTAAQSVGGLRLADAWAWPWPADPGGMALATWLQPGWAQVRLNTAGTEPLSLHAPRVLSYLPGQRCALRWHDHTGRPVLVQKAQRGAAQSHTAMLRLWQQPGRRFGMAEPLATDATADVRWERFVPGRRLEQVAAEQGWEPVLRQALVALVDLHGSALPGLPRQGRREVLARLQGKVLRRIDGALPALAPACRQLTDVLASAQPADEGPLATLHGDLHTGNLLMTPEGRVVFIDLDSLVQGAPAYDLALLATRLMLVGLIEPAQQCALAAPLAQLPQWYVQAGGDPAALGHYTWHVSTLLLARQIKTCIRHLAPGMHELAAGLLALAQRVHDDGELTPQTWHALPRSRKAA